MQTLDQDQELLDALDTLSSALVENSRRNELIMRRIAKIKRLRGEGYALSEIVSEDDRPLIVELLSQNMEVLTTAGTRLRRTEARTLHAEGLSMERIAHLFGVSRQRISELLRHGGARAT